MKQRFNGKVVLVTGGAGGAGAAAANMFAEEGGRVGIIDRSKEDGERVASEIITAGGEAFFAQADVSRSADVIPAVQAITNSFGPPTVLFNHAGTIIVKPFLETTEDEWDWLMAVNVKSMFLVTKAVLPGMIKAGGGSIVCTSSISAIAATPMEVVYNTSKGACHMFARAIAVDFRDRNIRCNAVCPGFIRTPHGISEVEKLTALGIDASESVIAAQQGRMCEPEEVARAVLFLASDDASFINGTHLFVDNGFTAV
jgi:NAD(P)-dependent dehydrogenase (short-subunit alcohol dehydrogenase family)